MGQAQDRQLRSVASDKAGIHFINAAAPQKGLRGRHPLPPVTLLFYTEENGGIRWESYLIYFLIIQFRSFCTILSFVSAIKSM